MPVLTKQYSFLPIVVSTRPSTAYVAHTCPSIRVLSASQRSISIIRYPLSQSLRNPLTDTLLINLFVALIESLLLFQDDRRFWNLGILLRVLKICCKLSAVLN